jgi:hypothetical protein
MKKNNPTMTDSLIDNSRTRYEDLEALIGDSQVPDRGRIPPLEHAPLTPTALGELLKCETRYYLLRRGQRPAETKQKRRGRKIHLMVENRLKNQYNGG